MSAFVCSDKHISTIANYISVVHSDIDAQALANKLKKINIQSVNYRYKEKTRATRCKLTTNCLPVYDVIQLVKCWDLQSCEGKDSLDYQITMEFLYSFFTEEQLQSADNHSTIWSI